MDFPQAQVHLLQREIDTAQQRHSWLNHERYRPGQWQSVSGWHGYAAQGEKWFGFDAVTALQGLPPEILLIPLPGHTLGHAGIAVQHGNGWLLHGGDAWFYRGEMGQAARHCTPGLRFYQWMMAMDNGARRENQRRLRELSLARQGDLQMVCSHDARTLQALQNS